MRVGRAILGVFASNGLTLVLAIGNSIFLTRTLGVAGKGEFALFSASFGILCLLLGFGLDISLRYFVAKGKVAREEVLTSLLLYAGGVGVMVFVLARLNHTFFSNDILLPFSKQSPLFEATLAGVVATSLVHGNVSAVFAGSRSFAAMNVASIGFAAVSLVTYGVMFQLGASGTVSISVGHVFLIYFALAVFNAAVLGVLAYRLLGVFPSRRLVNRQILGEMWRYGRWGYASALAQFLNYRLDYWLVQGLVSTVALGLYSLASNLAMMLWVLPRAAQNVLLPALAAGELHESHRYTAQMGRLVLWFVAMLALPAGLLAESWITTLYGSEFRTAASAFRILLVGCVPFTLTVVLAAAHAARERQDVNLVASCLGLAITVALDLLLIPEYGIEGAAAATAISYLATTAYMVGAFSYGTNVSYSELFLPQSGDLAYLAQRLRELAGKGSGP